MKKDILLFCFVFFMINSQSQNASSVSFPKHLNATKIAGLLIGDSLIYYQCHVDSASQETTTSNGQKLKTKKKKITLTEKIVIHKLDSSYNCNYFTSTITNYPNKKFPYLTLKEVENWEFELRKQKVLTNTEVYLIAAMETKTHCITHYELNINKTCPNEIIIKGKNINEQFIVEGNYVLSKILNCQ